MTGPGAFCGQSSSTPSSVSTVPVGPGGAPVHELSLAEGILQLVERARERDPFERVARLRLEAGALCGVEVSALRFALAVIAAGTCLEAAVIDIDEPAAAAWCAPCEQAVSIRSRLEPCPLCGGHQLNVSGGTELRVVDLQVV